MVQSSSEPDPVLAAEEPAQTLDYATVPVAPHPDAPELAAEGSDLRLLLRVSGPIIVATISQTMMRFVDFAMVSRLGTDAQAAIGASGVTLFVLIGFWIGLMSCVNTFASQALGRNEPHECGAYVWQALYVAIFAELSALPLWPLVPPLFEFFSHGTNVVPLETIYMQIGLPSVGFFAAEVALSNFFNGVHRPRVTMISALGANLLNVAADWILIYGKLGFPRMGVAGASLATTICMGVRVVWLIVAMLWPYYAERFGTRRAWRWNRTRTINLLRVGLPAGVQFTMDILAWSVFMMWLVGRFGPKHLAATNIVWQFLHLSFMPALGIGIGLTAVVGKAIGERRVDKAKRRTRIAMGLCGTYMASCGLAFFLLRGFIIRLFNADPEVIRLGEQLMVCGAIFQLFDAMCLVYSSSLKGAGDTVWPAVALVVTCWIVLVGGGSTLARRAPELGALGPWIAATAYVILLGLILAGRWWRGQWQKIDIFAGEIGISPTNGLAEPGRPHPGQLD
jgi:MATE family multidrug resistance protein